MESRLQSSILAGALMRRAESEGGFAAVLARGDSSAGAIIVILAEKGRKLRIIEQVLGGDGRYSWQSVGPQAVDSSQEIENFLARRRSFDPDLWLIELDVASAERFAAEMNEAI